MECVLLDTSVASMLLSKDRWQRELGFYQPCIEERTVVLSFQSVAELLRLPLRNGWSQGRRRKLDAFLRHFLVLRYDVTLAETWARVMVEAERAGRRLEAGVAWIAATAVRRNLTLLAHDRDFLSLPIPDLRVVSALQP